MVCLEGLPVSVWCVWKGFLSACGAFGRASCQRVVCLEGLHVSVVCLEGPPVSVVCLEGSLAAWCVWKGFLSACCVWKGFLSACGVFGREPGSVP